MDLQTLQKKGVVVRELPGQDGFSFRLDETMLEKIPDPVSPYSRLRLCDYSLAGFRSGNAWVLESTQTEGGPSQGDFAAQFDSFEKMADTVNAYYFEAPEKIGEWRIPFHRLPHLNKAKAVTMIDLAASVSPGNFEGIRERRYNQQNGPHAPLFFSKGKSRGERFSQYHFYEFPSPENGRRLMLRYDLEEAYIITG